MFVEDDKVTAEREGDDEIEFDSKTTDDDDGDEGGDVSRGSSRLCSREGII